MVKVFSFCLYGTKDKYIKGLIKNIELITKEFPDFEIWVWLGTDTDAPFLPSYPNVKYIHTGVYQHENMFYRFFPIDDPDVEIAIVRDADSRVYERDVGFIREFLASDKKFHIIHDHINHFNCGKIMAGMWGIKQGLLKVKIYDLYLEWKEKNRVHNYWDDMRFIGTLYPLVSDNALYHKSVVPNLKDFVGQVYDFKDGEEITIF